MLSVLSGDSQALEVTRETATTLLPPFTSLAVSSVTDSVMQTYAFKRHGFVSFLKIRIEESGKRRPFLLVETI
jgi:hypothetical protein